MSFNATTSKFSDFIRGLPAAAESDLSAGNNMPLVRAGDVKGLPGGAVAKAGDVENALDGNINVTEPSAEYGFTIAHLQADGNLNLTTKNVIMDDKVFAIKGSRISVDDGYKYQYGLWSKDVGRWIRRVDWSTEETVLDDNYYIKVEIATNPEVPQTDTSIAGNLHLKLFSSSVPLKKKIGDFENDIASIEKGNICIIEEATGYEFIIAHMNPNGTPNLTGKNGVVMDNKVLAVAGSRISADVGYKYMYALWNKSTDSFIRRSVWVNGAQETILDDDYLIRVEIANVAEVPQTDTSNADHLHLALFSKNKTLKEEFENVRNEIAETEVKETDSFFQLVQQTDNVVDVLGDSFVGRKIVIAPPDKYSCWPFVAALNDRVVCSYAKQNDHMESATGKIYSRVSSNGIIWTPKKIAIDTTNIRDGVTGIGNDSNGNVILFNRVGSPSGSSTYFDVYRTKDGFEFEKISSNVFGAGHIGDIINVPGVGLMAFFHTYGNPYGTGMSWGKIVSADGGVTWTATTIESDLDGESCPCEISAQYIQDGKILAIGRHEAYTGTIAQWQLQSSDYGETWSRNKTNLAYGGSCTSSMLYNINNGKMDVYTYKRSTGQLYHSINNWWEVWGSPNSWDVGNVIASGRTGINSGNVNAVKYKGKHIVSFYDGTDLLTGIYAVIVSP